MPSTLVSCPHCRQPAPVSNERLGQAVRCPRCGQAIQTKAVPRPKSGWFVLKNDKQVGPFPIEILKRLAESGHLKADTWLIMAETDACVLAATVPGLLFRPRKAKAKPKPQSAPAAATPLPAARAPQRTAPVAAPKPAETVSVDCPTCRGKCLIPRPQTPAIFTCPRCKQPFRAANTSLGVVGQRLPPSSATVHKGSTRTGLP